MTPKKLKSVRRRMRYSMQELADCLGIPKSTYQRYEDGSAAIPAKIERDVLYYQELDRKFFAGLPARVDSELKKQYPMGIITVDSMPVLQ